MGGEGGQDDGGGAAAEPRGAPETAARCPVRDRASERASETYTYDTHTQHTHNTHNTHTTHTIHNTHNTHNTHAQCTQHNMHNTHNTHTHPRKTLPNARQPSYLKHRDCRPHTRHSVWLVRSVARARRSAASPGLCPGSRAQASGVLLRSVSWSTLALSACLGCEQEDRMREILPLAHQPDRTETDGSGGVRAHTHREAMSRRAGRTRAVMHMQQVSTLLLAPGSLCLSVCLSVCRSVCLSVCRSVCLSVCRCRCALAALSALLSAPGSAACACRAAPRQDHITALCPMSAPFHSSMCLAASCLELTKECGWVGSGGNRSSTWHEGSCASDGST
eukprot:171422-Rhodomonas_salina.1